MSNIKKMEMTMSVILTVGMIISVVLVMLGGTLFLLQHGGESVSDKFTQDDNFSTNVGLIMHSALSFSPFGIIELGVLVLVATQAIRVGLLVWFYGVIRDYWFVGISLFILGVLVYSLFFR